MWLKNFFAGKQNQQKLSSDKNASSQFEIQETNEDSSPLIDQLPDLRYNSIQQALQKIKIPFPQTLLHPSDTIIFSKIAFEDGFLCRSAYNSFTQCKIVCTDRQLLVTPNLLSHSLKTKSLDPNFLDIALGQIQKNQLKQVKKQPLKLHFTLKDNRQLIFTNILGNQVKSFHQKIAKFTLVNGINKLYAFQYKKKWADSQIKIQKGWEIYNIRNEFIRQGATKYFSLEQNEKQFKFAYKIIKNHSFQISPTYPPQFFVPFNLTKEEIAKGSKFRTRQRIPALTYFYEYKPECYATIFRCSQIKTGVMGNRCEQDEKMIREIAESSNFISKKKKIYLKHNVKIYDARGYYAALGNMLAGKGYQKQDTYNCDIQFLNIPNIHAVRDSYIKVKNSNLYEQQMYDVLISSSWIQYIALILAGAKQMAYDLMDGKNVLVHCSDGWDRTSQLSSLCQLLLDPYYRTLQGIAVLIQKDWRHFGHKFRQRTGQFHPSSYHPYEKSPVFIQFLDCIYQIQRHFPLSFEYNGRLLQYLSIHVNSCIYGTFLANNMKQASQVKIESQTVSIWTDVIFSQGKQEFINPFYRQDLNTGFLNISLDIKNMHIWKEHLFYEYGDSQTCIFSYEKQKLINKALRQQFYSNQKMIAQLKKQLSDQK